MESYNNPTRRASDFDPEGASSLSGYDNNGGEPSAYGFDDSGSTSTRFRALRLESTSSLDCPSMSAPGSSHDSYDEEEHGPSYLDLDQERHHLGPTEVVETCDSAEPQFDPGLTKKGKPRKVKDWMKYDLTNDPDEKASYKGAKTQWERRKKQQKDLVSLKQDCENLKQDNIKAVQTIRALQDRLKISRENESKLQKQIKKLDRNIQELKENMKTYTIRLQPILRLMGPNSKDGNYLQSIYKEMVECYQNGSEAGFPSDF